MVRVALLVRSVRTSNTRLIINVLYWNRTASFFGQFSIEGKVHELARAIVEAKGVYSRGYTQDIGLVSQQAGVLDVPQADEVCGRDEANDTPEPDEPGAIGTSDPPEKDQKRGFDRPQRRVKQDENGTLGPLQLCQAFQDLGCRHELASV